MERNKLSEEESLKRINSQMTNEERISKSNVVLSTLWEYEVTQKQAGSSIFIYSKQIYQDIKAAEKLPAAWWLYNEVEF